MTSDRCGARACGVIAVAHHDAWTEHGASVDAQMGTMNAFTHMFDAPLRRTAGPIAAALLAGAALFATASFAAEQPYPFEGTWVRADRICSPTAPSARTYTAHEVILPGGRCAVRKAAFGSGEWEIFEECRRPERPGAVTERIKMLGQDAVLIKRQVARLKIPRGRRYIRCSIAAPGKAAAEKPAAPSHAAPALQAAPPKP
jgi:hypothetical protein